MRGNALAFTCNSMTPIRPAYAIFTPDYDFGGLAGSYRCLIIAQESERVSTHEKRTRREGLKRLERAVRVITVFYTRHMRNIRATHSIQIAPA